MPGKVSEFIITLNSFGAGEGKWFVEDGQDWSCKGESLYVFEFITLDVVQITEIYEDSSHIVSGTGDS